MTDSQEITCPACSASNPNHAQFCMACGAPLGSVAEADRRIVTVVFADLSGFTQLTERLDPEEVRDLVANCLGRLSDCVTRWGGFVDKFIGDCVMALFGAPVAYENEEERAIRAALDMHEVFRLWTEESPLTDAEGTEYRPDLRIGINTGPVVTGVFGNGSARNYTAVGDTVNVASRLQGLCELGRILVGPATYAHTRHLFEYDDGQRLQVRGRSEPVLARHLVGVRPERAKARGFLGVRLELVNRREEIAALREHWRRASGGESRICLVSGAAGIGKSHLVEELIALEGLGPDAIAIGRSYPYASSTPWESVADLLRDLHDLPRQLAAGAAAMRIVQNLGEPMGAERISALKLVLGETAAELPDLKTYSDQERAERIIEAVSFSLRRRNEEPLLLVLEDLQWADRATLELLGRLFAAGQRGAVLLLLVSRPPLPDELLLETVHGAVPHRIDLERLSIADSHVFVNSLLERHELPPDLVNVLIDRSDGNPLYLEELVKSLVEKETLTNQDGTWRLARDMDSLEIPDSIEKVLTTRIDGLETPTKQVLQYASVIGRRFWSGVLGEALARRPVEGELDDLQKAALVRDLPTSEVRGDREYMFEHLLLQEATYEGMLRSSRADLHGAVARWFEDSADYESGQFDEWIAYHYERSSEPERSLPYLERAARNAWRRGALLDAAALVDRALNAAGSGDKSSLLPLSEEIALAMGDDQRRLATIIELEELAIESDDTQLAAEACFRRARYQLDAGDLEDALATGRAALKLFEVVGDVSLQGDAYRLLGRVSHLWGDYPGALRCYRSSLELEKEAGDRHGQAEIFDQLGLVQVDLGNFITALDYFAAAHDLSGELGNRAAEARVLAHESTALRWLGRFDEACGRAEAAMKLAEESGSRRALASAKLNLAMALAAKGDTERAHPLLHAVIDMADATKLNRPGMAARATLVLAQTGAGEAARASANRARRLAGESGLVHVQVLALAREASLDLEDGRLEEADATSKQAVELLDYHCNIQGPEELVLYTRSRVLNALDRGQEAQGLLGRARTIVVNKLDRIEDPDLKEQFLESTDYYREIMSSEASRPGTI